MFVQFSFCSAVFTQISNVIGKQRALYMFDKEVCKAVGSSPQSWVIPQEVVQDTKGWHYANQSNINYLHFVFLLTSFHYPTLLSCFTKTMDFMEGLSTTRVSGQLKELLVSSLRVKALMLCALKKHIKILDTGL